MHLVERHTPDNALCRPGAFVAAGACQPVHRTYLRTVAWAPVPRTCCLSVPSRLYWLLNPSSVEAIAFRAASDPGSASSLLEAWCLHMGMLHHHFRMCPNMTATELTTLPHVWLIKLHLGAT